MPTPLRSFMGDDFLLGNSVAQQLYDQYARPMPVLDYHNHLSPKDIAENRKFANITEAWLEGDHYKWRAMRINGINEKYVTGNASSKEKFTAWAKTVPATLRNPLYHWTHLELKGYFGITELLNENNAAEIEAHCSSLLQQDDFCARGLLKKMNVEVVCTTDDPADSLEYHRQFASGDLKMYPTFRPDKSYTTGNPAAWNEYISELGSIAKISITSFDNLVAALSQRINFFADHGCKSADHGLESLYFDADAVTNAPRLFLKLINGESLTTIESQQFKNAVLQQLCTLYHAAGWVQQFHLGALRSNNTRMFYLLGPDTGFDSIGEFPQAQHMAAFFDSLDKHDRLAKTVIYNLNPSQNEVFASMAGNFSDGTVAGKIQFGSAWWFLDQKDGMEKQINTLSNMGLLSRFIGMITDSRSFLSFPRHEYFRRILCNIIGKDVANGELPNDIPLLGKMVSDICYNNTKTYFRF